MLLYSFSFSNVIYFIFDLYFDRVLFLQPRPNCCPWTARGSWRSTPTSFRSRPCFRFWTVFWYLAGRYSAFSPSWRSWWQPTFGYTFVGILEHFGSFPSASAPTSASNFSFCSICWDVQNHLIESNWILCKCSEDSFWTAEWVWYFAFFLFSLRAWWSSLLYFQLLEHFFAEKLLRPALQTHW